MGILEFAVLGALAWLIVWTVIVFLQTIFYGCLSCTTAFASYYFFTLPVDPNLAQPIAYLGNYGLTTVDLVTAAMLIVTFILFGKFKGAASTASERFLKILPWG